MNRKRVIPYPVPMKMNKRNQDFNCEMGTTTPQKTEIKLLSEAI